MERTLGLDLGTNSLGWAIVDSENNNYTLIDCGTDIFQEGVAREKNNEKPATQDRTAARGLRRQYARRREKKIRLLKILVEHRLCPPLTDDEIALWRRKKIYPLNRAFLEWQKTDELLSKNPYYDRYRCLRSKLDLSDEKDRYILGRALYHLCQRRGFLSNRKDVKSDSKESGVVKESISKLSADMAEAGCEYLGEYFYVLYEKKEKIRGHYTSRKEHYEKEFDEICRVQQLDQTLVDRLCKVLFYQRPLRSQKHLVGKCPFETSKTRCLVSHPDFEEFRMLQLVNNIRIAYADEEPRPLDDSEREKAFTVFYRKSKKIFDFGDIVKAVAGRSSAKKRIDVKFNYDDAFSVAGSPVTAQLREIFGEDWRQEIFACYQKRGSKTVREVVNDVWHALISFDDEDRLAAWAVANLQLDADAAAKFARIRTSGDYASLSLNAIQKILPYLRRGLRYDEAVMLANLRKVLPGEFADDKDRMAEIEEGVADTIRSYRRDREHPSMTKEASVKDYLLDACGGLEIKADRLYHPSKTEVYETSQPGSDGLCLLGSPILPALKNPMVMRSLHRLRALVNQLLKKRMIDQDTKINIEFARGLNTANMRMAISQYQREREKLRENCRQKLREAYESIGSDSEPSEADLLRCLLWEEQKHCCLYTGRQIGITQIIGDNPEFDIEHTLPRSKGGDNSLMNKTLCDVRYNREVKGSRLPSSLAGSADIIERIRSAGWHDTIESLKKQAYGARARGKKASTKEEKDRARQNYLAIQMKLDYWCGKLRRFEMTEVPEGFSNRQGVDIGIIGRYARLYLKTVFSRIYVVKGEATAEFRKMWGLQSESEAKIRDSHFHHCIDAVTIACIDKYHYDLWSHFVNESERYRLGLGDRPVFPKPWPTFTQDVRSLSEIILVSHHSPDNLPKKARRLLRRNGKIVSGKDDAKLFQQGDGVRGSLHQETLYGAVMKDDKVRYVVRKSLRSLAETDVKNIVDAVVRQKVEKAIAEVGFARAMDIDNYTIWMNEEKRVPILKVRIYVPGIMRPIHLKKHRDLSTMHYKQYVNVANDSNYCLAIYEGTDSKGKPKRTFKLVNNIEAARFFNGKTDADFIVPKSDKNGYPLKHLLKRGKMVIFYEKSPSELIGASNAEISKRLYIIDGICSKVSKPYLYGYITMRHHLEARPTRDLKIKKGEWRIGEEHRPMIEESHLQFNALVEGYDFRLTVDGKIEFIKNLT